MKELNIVFIGSTPFPKGGAGTKRIRYMIDYLNENKIESHVLITRSNPVATLNNPRKGLYGICSFCNINDQFQLKNFPSFYKVGNELLKQWYQKGKKNILIFPTVLACTDYPFYRTAKRLGFHIVFDKVETSFLANGTKHDSFYKTANIFLSERLTEKACKKGASSFVISTLLEKENKQKFPLMKTCVLPNSTPVICDKTRENLNTPLKILYSGTFGEKDGVDFLIKGFLKARQTGCHCQLILIGKGTETQMKVIKDIQDRDDCQYLGFVSDEVLERNLKECDILAMTRRNSVFANYGFPFKLSEYLATGNVVIASKVGDVPLFLENKKNAFLVEPEDADAIAKSILYIDKNREEAIKIGQAGLEVMRQQFSINHIGNKVVNFLHSL